MSKSSSGDAGMVTPQMTEHTLRVTDTPQVTFQRCKLVRIEGPGRITEYEVEEGETVVGSSSKCHVTLNDSTVSRRHFAVIQDQQKYMLRDLGSTNGTFVDDLRINEVFLQPGALIRAGDVFLRFELAYRPANLVPSESDQFGKLLGRSLPMRHIFSALEKVAPSNATVLLQGETGCGKGAVARALHEASSRADGPFVVFDCASTAPSLVESELFGHEKGAFTGAVNQRRGALEESNGGTLFIDELVELSLALQPKLLRALEEREFTRVGSHKIIKLDCRIVAATQRELWHEVLAERFRRDLYYRLAVVTIPLPRLKERREDIPLLVDLFLGDLAEGGSPQTFADLEDDFKQKLLNYEWTGNVRELRNVIERFVVMGTAEAPLGFGDDTIFAAGPRTGAGGEGLDGLVDFDLPFKEAKEMLLGEFEKAYVERLLARSKNNIAEAARQAGLGRKHLYTLLSKHGLSTSRD